MWCNVYWLDGWCVELFIDWMTDVRNCLLAVLLMWCNVYWLDGWCDVLFTGWISDLMYCSQIDVMYCLLTEVMYCVLIDMMHCLLAGDVIWCTAPAPVDVMWCTPPPAYDRTLTQEKCVDCSKRNDNSPVAYTSTTHIIHTRTVYKLFRTKRQLNLPAHTPR